MELETGICIIKLNQTINEYQKRWPIEGNYMIIKESIKQTL